ncbi:MAG: aminotransferase class I/II-fold pyridoxal phosphate-dependent enzyme [Paracoccaceae bacterium]
MYGKRPPGNGWEGEDVLERVQQRLDKDPTQLAVRQHDGRTPLRQIQIMDGGHALQDAQAEERRCRDGATGARRQHDPRHEDHRHPRLVRRDERPNRSGFAKQQRLSNAIQDKSEGCKGSIGETPIQNQTSCAIPASFQTASGHRPRGGARLLVDEVYADLEWKRGGALSRRAYDRGNTSGSVSKALGLQRLRAGWIYDA